jgi:hypothetical protein
MHAGRRVLAGMCVYAVSHRRAYSETDAAKHMSVLSAIGMGDGSDSQTGCPLAVFALHFMSCMLPRLGLVLLA